MSSLKYPIQWIRSSSDLAYRCSEWLALDLIAVDTEFIRTDTYYPIPALLQVHDGRANYLIDPLAIDDWTSLTQVMVSASVSKVMHACSEDLEVFHHLLGTLPENVLDTQIAAALCGYGYSVGYANLVERMLQVVVPKGETRSNWLKRPLSEAQELYAALDVEYLYALARQLLATLESLGRRSWLEAEYQTMCRRFLEMQQPENAVARLKGAARLRGKRLALLHELATWREGLAKARNTPRNRIISDRALFDIAHLRPRHISQLHGLGSLHASAIRRHGEAVIALAEQVESLDDDQLPRSAARPLDVAQRRWVSALRDKVGVIAAAHQVAPELVARRSDYEHMVRAVEQGATGQAVLSPATDGWRAKLILTAIEEIT